MANELMPTYDGGAIVDLSQQERMEQAFNEIVNLAPVIKNSGKSYPSYFNEDNTLDGEKCLVEMGNLCREDFKTDLASRSTWEEKTANIIKLFSTFTDPKTFPWAGCSNVSLPVVTIAAVQFHARAFEQLIPSKDVVKVVPISDEDIPRADRVHKYLNYQLLHQMREFTTNMDKTILQTSLIGSTFKKTFYSFELNRPVSHYVSAKNIVFPYHMSDFESAPRKSHVIYLTKNEIRRRVNAGIFVQDAWKLGPGSVASDDISTAIKNIQDTTQGINNPASWYDTPRIIIEQHRDWDLDGDGIQEPYVITVDYETGLILRITKRTFHDVRGQERVIDYFTHYYFLPNPEGVYGLGLGTMLSGITESMNSILNEVIDAGSLANLVGGFVSKRSGLKKGDLKFEMGMFKEVDAYVDDIQKALYTLDFKGPNSTLYSTLGLLYEYAKLVSSVSETMTGQLPASDTPATTVMALIEEGRKVYSTIYKRIHHSFTEEIRKIYTLNGLFLDDETYFQVLGDKYMQIAAEMGTGRMDFRGETDVVPVSDPNILSRAEKVLKAQQLLVDVRSNPLTASNQQSNYEATRLYYEALEIPNIDKILQPPAPSPDVDPVEENSMFLKDENSAVLPEQDHLRHMEVHDSFMQTPFGAELSPNGKNIMERHRKEHLSALYMTQSAYGSQGVA